MTPLEPIHPAGQRPIAAPLSPAVRVGDLLFVSGIPGYDTDGTLASDFPTQLRQVMETIRGIRAAAGAGFDRVAKVNAFIVRQEDWATLNAIYAGYFAEGHYPARTTVVVAALPRPEFLLEIECVAVLR